MKAFSKARLKRLLLCIGQEGPPLTFLQQFKPRSRLRSANKLHSSGFICLGRKSPGVFHFVRNRTLQCPQLKSTGVCVKAGWSDVSVKSPERLPAHFIEHVIPAFQTKTGVCHVLSFHLCHVTGRTRKGQVKCSTDYGWKDVSAGCTCRGPGSVPSTYVTAHSWDSQT